MNRRCSLCGHSQDSREMLKLSSKEYMCAERAACYIRKLRSTDLQDS
jgi:hypothetical protein